MFNYLIETKEYYSSLHSANDDTNKLQDIIPIEATDNSNDIMEHSSQTVLQTHNNTVKNYYILFLGDNPNFVPLALISVDCDVC